MPELDIICLGNAIADLITTETSSYLARNQQDRGGFFYTTTEEFKDICNNLSSYIAHTGGCVANSSKTLAKLGSNVGFMGKIGTDEMGAFFEQTLTEQKVKTFLSADPNNPTGKLVVFVHPDAEKTICGKRGATKHITIQDLDWATLKNTKYIFVEAHLLDGSLETFIELINFAHQQHIKLAVNLCDPKVVAENINFFKDNLPKIDIVIGNEQEFAALGDLIGTTINVKTKGKEGVEVWQLGAWQQFSALPIKKVVSTNGAGDAFAGGFLHGLINNHSIEDSVFLGQSAALEALSKLSA